MRWKLLNVYMEGHNSCLPHITFIICLLACTQPMPKQITAYANRSEKRLTKHEKLP